MAACKKHENPGPKTPKTTDVYVVGYGRVSILIIPQ